MRETGDLESAAVLDVIYNDEKGHVAIGAKWFRFLCAREKRDPARTFHELVRANFRGPLKAPFNDIARAEAGLTPVLLPVADIDEHRLNPTSDSHADLSKY